MHIAPLQLKCFPLSSDVFHNGRIQILHITTMQPLSCSNFNFNFATGCDAGC